MEAFSLPPIQRGQTRPTNGKSDGENDGSKSGVKFTKHGAKFYLPALFPSAPTIKSGPLPMLVTDVHRLEDCRTVYKNDGFEAAMYGITMYNNFPVKDVKVQGKIVGERWQELSPDSFFMFLEICDGSSDAPISVKVRNQLYYQQLTDYDQNGDLLVQVRGQGVFYNGKVEIHAHWIEVVGDKRDMGLEMDWWEQTLDVRRKFLEDPWEFTGSVEDEVQKYDEFRREENKRREEYKELLAQEKKAERQKQIKLHEKRLRELEKQERRSDDQSDDENTQEQTIESQQADTTAESVDSIVNTDEPADESETSPEVEDGSNTIKQENSIQIDTVVEQPKPVEETSVPPAEVPVITVPTPQIRLQTEQVYIPPQLFTGSRISVDLLDKQPGSDDKLKLEILTFCMNNPPKFSIHKVMADKAVRLQLLQDSCEELLDKTYEVGGEFTSDMLQMKDGKFDPLRNGRFHTARKALCRTKLVRLTKSLNFETKPLKQAQNYISALAQHVMKTEIDVLQELFDDYASSEEILQQLSRFYTSTVKHYTFRTSDLGDRLKEHFKVDPPAHVTRRLIIHELLQAGVSRIIQPRSLWRLRLTWYYKVSEDYWMYLPEIVSNEK
ncbi:hypothetical protein OGAPHI_005313 [Ogataea philodendri]|uniref:CST complex subunit Stn1 N-terminal domain-containing protein n=2 Tax=Ogataea TaxID=461281 RepID=A0A9P8NZZ8_9ASCO|nr:uncharacterized protein OGAPHI_005313 [Ogataea philodendri]KAH3663323.1 hypothetical protein OGAPHI_005313 [Ogataea philodendri]